MLSTRPILFNFLTLTPLLLAQASESQTFNHRIGLVLSGGGDTSLGPIYLGLGISATGDSGIYALLGRRIW